MLGMTRQEMFDKMVNHLREQKVVSRDDETDTCLYRGPNGTKCAIGCLIPDDLYSSKMEEKGVDYLREYHTNLKIAPGDVEFLNQMQDAHDTYLSISLDRFETIVKEIAEEYNLVYTEPTED